MAEDPAKTRERYATRPEVRAARLAGNQRWRDDNRDAHNERQKQYYQKNKDKFRDRLFRKKYGITLDEYNEMLELQDHCCLTCDKHEDDNLVRGKSQALAVDHCHETGEIRGILCDTCNRAIGLLKEDIPTLKNIIRYLER